ncbi:ABC transporter permease [Mucilaginibacter sp. ZB1P21]|uniref:ABC transporter permease n=2 Tax=Mucilaginibacter glaciei TaxID=2772109 RepID=A0A926NQP5_9SPHI|nr:ABC transporter permease [Mucilaginibacter glaciei]
MFKNHLKIALRQLSKQKMYATIKVGGFAFSVAACILIALYIKSETGYDKAYPDADRIYRVIGQYNVDGVIKKGPSLPAPFGKVLTSNFPEVEQSARIMPNALFDGAGSNEVSTANDTQNTHEDGFAYADQELLNLLQLPMVYGDRKHALDQPFTVVIAKSKADKYFPKQNPLGKLIYLNGDKTKPYKIGGVMQDFPASSHLQYSFLLTLTGKELWPGEQTGWGSSNYTSYVKLRPGTDVPAFEKKLVRNILNKYIIPDMVKAGNKRAADIMSKSSLHLQPIGDVNLKSYDIDDNLSHGDIRFIWLFGGVAGFILIIACINFINLSTARSANRAKEVGLRKVVGSSRAGLVQQFITESLLYSFLSFAIAIIIAVILLPYFNLMAGKTLSLQFQSWWLLPSLIVAAVVVGIAAGIYPALYLSAFKPIAVLKGKLSTGSKSSFLRNGLVVFQFATSIILIIGTLVIYNQMEFIMNKKLGYDKDQVVMLQGTDMLGSRIKELKNELLKIADVKSVTISDFLPVAGTKRNGNVFYNEGKTLEEEGSGAQYWFVDTDYLKTMGIKLVAGRNFSAQMAGDSQAVIINQTMANKLNLKNPVGKRIANNGAVNTIIGVVHDFNFESLRDNVDGLVMQLSNQKSSIVSVKLNTGNVHGTLSAINGVWKTFAPAQPIRYTFMDERFASMYADVQRMGRIFTSFAILAIVIASLGLFGLSAFMAEQRSKEIGIRKVLGASISSITALLSMDFLKLVGIAIVIATPIGWWGMHAWLQDFANRTPIQWWVFILAAISAIVIAVITISFQSIKAAMMNPVKSLKAE